MGIRYGIGVALEVLAEQVQGLCDLISRSNWRAGIIRARPHDLHRAGPCHTFCQTVVGTQGALVALAGCCNQRKSGFVLQASLPRPASVIIWTQPTTRLDLQGVLAGPTIRAPDLEQPGEVLPLRCGLGVGVVRPWSITQ